MKMQVKMMLDETMEPLDQLELIDNLERLGISYHFEDEIEQILAFINRKYSRTLEFRLLRQHDFNVSQERFDCFKNEKGSFKPSLCNDTKGLPQLYEASFLSIEGESTLEMAREFTIKHLEDKSVDDIHCDPLVHHALEIPLHWTIPRAEATRFINKYEKRPDKNPILLQLAKLDFNIVQATYLEELKYVSRWDVNAIEQLPDYMQIFYLALNNFINEMAYDVLREKGIVIIPYLRKVDELGRGDVPKSIQCYMNETGASEDESRKHIRFLICKTWKKINKGRDANCPFSQTFIEIAANLARMAQYMYQYGDGHGIQNRETKDRILALLFEPIPLK
ncbi:terpene synthase 10-like [Olea europaea subsp. europaea]|uniref:Terpene synthase 10-like n=1 Tax=Olea europaea subsp. europaea TaxID=158383 RepID=A0A8S0R804_OLEEU|nr:terpene synthase 10-like [Olea europaea subsp. europaea]